MRIRNGQRGACSPGRGSSEGACGCLKKTYNGAVVDIAIEFYASAFDHGVSREDIVHALNTKIYDSTMAGFYNKYAVIGFDRAGNPLEIMYNPIDDDTIGVFHAMKARKTFMVKLGL